MIEFRFHDEFKTTSMSKLKNNILERFDELKKEIVIYNANIFNEKNINSYNCIEILINLVYLLNQGEKFTKSEKENLFFSVTKLFYSNDVELRRVIYLFIRHLDFYENSFILTGTLINEINKSEQMLKPNGFRMMGQIVDATSVAPIEKLLKNAISSNVPEICSSAVLCTLYMCLKGFNIAKPWISEITDKLNSSLSQSNLLTFHTLLLLREIKDSDRLFLLKTFANLCSTNLKSQFATCQLIRYIVDFLRRGEVEDNKTYSLFVNFLETCLFKQQQEAIILEAARGLLSLPLKETLLTSTFETLKNLLSNGKRVVKYATLKILDRVCGKYANILSLQFFLELEKIIDDSANNSSIKAVALSIFLKISKGLSDYRLEKMFKTFCEQYTSFKEEFKKEIVCISREISRENTSKNKLYFNFFSSLLKLDASFGTKLEILESIIWYIYNDADLKRPGVLCLAEYIEDCQYDNLKTKILHVLGKEGPTANSPSQLVRYIYNRIILENAAVRAAAISALGEIANKDTSLKKNILNLIKGSLNDSDNEVRERAFFYVKALEEKTNEIEDSQMIKSQGELKKFVFSNKTYDVDLIQNVLKAQKESLLSSKNIAQQLSQTLNDPESLAKILVNIPKPEVKNSETTAKTKSAEKKSTEDGLTGLDEYKKTIFYKAFGKPKLISQIHKLTDQYAEYTISYKKIVYDAAVILDFELTNTLEDNCLQNVTIEFGEVSSNPGFDLTKTEIIEIDKLNYNEPKHLFLKLVKKEEEIYAGISFNILLKFDVQELDTKGNPHGPTYKDQYKLDKKVEVTYSDYFRQNRNVNLGNFEEFWKLSENSNFFSEEEKIQLPYSNMNAVGKSFSQLIGFESLNDVEKVDKNAKKYEYLFSVISVYDSVLMVRLQVLFNQSNQCLARILIRSQDEAVSELVLNNIFKA